MARVLLVDDERSLRVTLSAFLTDAGHEVVVADDPDLAYNTFREGGIDVVLTDIILPQGSGVELLSRIRKLASHVPVILMTGEPSLETAAAAVREHAFDYLTKPVLKDKVVAAVALAALEKEREDELERLRVENLRRQKKLEETLEDQSVEIQSWDELLQDQEEATCEGEDRYDTLLDIVGDAIMLIDAETKRIVTVNDAALAMYGYSRDDFAGMDHSAITADPEKSQDSFDKILADGGTLAVPARHHRRADGEVFPVEITASLVSLSGKQMLCGVIRDISERKKNEEELRDKEWKLSTIIAHSREVFFIHDRNNRFTYASPQCEAIFGYSPSDVLVEWTEFLTDNPMNETGIELTQKALDTGERQKPYLLEIRHKDGRTRIVEVDESPFCGEDGQVIGMTGAVRDVTEREYARNPTCPVHHVTPRTT